MQTFVGKVADLLEMPKDVVLDLPRIEMTGNVRVLVENHRGIYEYTSDRLRLNTTVGEVAIRGTALVIRRILREAIEVEGNILRVEFIPEGTQPREPDAGGQNARWDGEVIAEHPDDPENE